MATTVKKVLGTSTKYVINFDAPPSAKDLLDMIKTIPVDERTGVLRTVGAGGGQALKAPTRFVFVLEAEQETDVPIV